MPIHDTHMSQFIPVSLFHHVTGTWTSTAGAVAGTIDHTVNDANQTSVTNIPIIIPSNDSDLKGSYLKSIEIDYEVRTAAMSSVTAVVNKVTRGAEGAAATVDVQASTQDLAAATDAADVDQHKLTVTLTTPIWLDQDEYVLVEITVDQAGDTGVLDFLGAVANYTARF